jgi:hypothetical protein
MVTGTICTIIHSTYEQKHFPKFHFWTEKCIYIRAKRKARTYEMPHMQRT